MGYRGTKSSKRAYSTHIQFTRKYGSSSSKSNHKAVGTVSLSALHSRGHRANNCAICVHRSETQVARNNNERTVEAPSFSQCLKDFWVLETPVNSSSKPKEKGKNNWPRCSIKRRVVDPQLTLHPHTKQMEGTKRRNGEALVPLLPLLVVNLSLVCGGNNATPLHGGTLKTVVP